MTLRTHFQVNLLRPWFSSTRGFDAKFYGSDALFDASRQTAVTREREGTSLPLLSDAALKLFVTGVNMPENCYVDE